MLFWSFVTDEADAFECSLHVWLVEIHVTVFIFDVINQKKGLVPTFQRNYNRG